MSNYHPDYWTIIDTGECCKVLAGWAGGYLDGDSWKLNSGITKIEDIGDYWIFHGVTGSTYTCSKNMKRTGNANYHIFKKMIDAGCKEIEVNEIKLVE